VLQLAALALQGRQDIRYPGDHLPIEEIDQLVASGPSPNQQPVHDILA
jgi:hypothetical protein